VDQLRLKAEHQVRTDAIVLGAGIVGVSAAIHLLRRGRSVLLIDRRAPGSETSYGNAGIIQREGIRPRGFPRDWKELLKVAGNRGAAARYDLASLPGFIAPLARYWWSSAPQRYTRIAASYAPLIGMSIDEHADLIAAAGAQHLIVKQGWLQAYRTAEALDAEVAKASAAYERYGVAFERFDPAALRSSEPALKTDMAGAIRWIDPWTVRSPGDLVKAYATHFVTQGGQLLEDDISAVEQDGNEWRVTTASETHTARDVVMAMGPWAKPALRRLGYRLPLFIKRGYHRHYRQVDGHALRNWVLDAEGGYLLSPQSLGIRLTTGAEFASHAKPPTPLQLARSEAAAAPLFHLGEPIEATPWMGARLCSPDMLPVIGAAHRHRGFWLGIGHSHHGFTLGPATGRLLAEMIAGENTAIDTSAFRASRF
jgi:D-amino-acid dehydrogenase